MDLATRDKFIATLQSEINKTQDSVTGYLEETKKVQGENEFLQSVTSDYKRYHKFIVDEKERERKQLEDLMGYLDKILEEADLSAEMANKARFQQNNILGEMDNIKGELDRITVKLPQTNMRNI